MNQRLNDVNPGIYAAYPELEDVIGETLIPSAQPPRNKPVYKQADEEIVQTHQITQQVNHSSNTDVIVKTIKLKLDIELNLKINTI